MKKKKFSLSNFLWDAWCICSVVGIWPRYIEPNLLHVTKKSVKIPGLTKDLIGLKIVQFSDLHLHSGMSDYFLTKIKNKIAQIKPDILVFTGDFLNRAELKDPEPLQTFLNGLYKAKYGSFAILGNHDYDRFISINEEGEYDVLDSSSSPISKGFSRLFSTVNLKKRGTDKVKNLVPHPKLEELLKNTPFQLLHNESTQLEIGNSKLNILGLGEYIASQMKVENAFKDYNLEYPGIILVHNPDAIPELLHHPGEIIICGHTHGGQINLPWISKKITVMENPKYKKGQFNVNKKWIYVNRGLGSVLSFRWFARPELLQITLS